MNRKFPEGFLWGAATSAPQSEGAQYEDGRTPSTWDKWFELEPEYFNQDQGPQETVQVYKRYQDDVKLMSAINHNSHRTSISWNRLLPDGKTVNEKAVQFYRDYFKRMKEEGVEPIVNLFHFDMPWWLMERGGWEARESADHFAHYAKVAFQQFGDIVHYWTTFNEPIVHVTCGYLADYHWPKVHDLKRAVQVAHHTCLAHAKAVIEFRTLDLDGKIGNILNLSPVYPRSERAEDLKAARDAHAIHVKSFLDPTVHGTYPEHLVTLLREHDLLPETEAEDLEIIAQGAVDFLGVNYYQPIRVKEVPEAERHHPAQSLEDFSRHYDWPEKRMNPYRGWEIYPKGIYDIAMMIKEDYNNIPWFISENGMGVAEEERFIDASGEVQDDYRIEFIHDHLEYALQAMEEGANCFGYHLWTFIDCWSWLNGFKNRYGYYRLDLETHERTPKKSAHWIKDIIASGELPELNHERK